MRTIYRDSDFRCHVADDGTFDPFETDFFDGKCDTFVEGYRVVLNGETWTRPDGMVFSGEMIAPWKDWRELDEAQREYERAQYAAAMEELSDLRSAMAILEVTPDEEVE